MSATQLLPARPSFGTTYAPLSLERSLARIDELLVRRASTPSWWVSLTGTLDDLSRALDEHRAAAAGRDGLHGQILAEHPRFAFDVGRLEKDHVELANDITELKGLVSVSSSHQGGLPLVLAGTTEVVARIRGHQRRLATVLHEAFQRDLGEGG